METPVKTDPKAQSKAVARLVEVLGRMNMKELSEEKLNTIRALPEAVELVRVAGETTIRRHRARASLEGAGVPVEIGEALFPRQRSARNVSRPTPDLPTPLANSLVTVLKTQHPIPKTQEFWTRLNVLRATLASVRLSGSNPESCHANIHELRKYLQSSGVPESLVQACHAPKLEHLRAGLGAESLVRRAEAGLVAPPELRRLGRVIDRVDQYLLMPYLPLSGLMLADLMVSLSMRPGETHTIRLVEETNGTPLISTPLKDSGEEAEAPQAPMVNGIGKCSPQVTRAIVSCIGTDRATRFLRKWLELRPEDREMCTGMMKAQVKEWGLQPKDLRPIGAWLLTRAANLQGPTSGFVERLLTSEALRHADGRIQSTDHYMCVKDPGAQLGALLSELPEEGVEEARKFIEALKLKHGVKDIVLEPPKVIGVHQVTRAEIDLAVEETIRELEKLIQQEEKPS